MYMIKPIKPVIRSISFLLTIALIYQLLLPYSVMAEWIKVTVQYPEYIDYSDGERFVVAAKMNLNHYCFDNPDEEDPPDEDPECEEEGDNPEALPKPEPIAGGGSAGGAGQVEWSGHSSPPNLDAGTGNNFFVEERIQLPSHGVPLELELIYQSISDRAPSTLGLGWGHNYDWYLDTYAPANVVLSTGAGNKYTFERNSDGTFTPPDGKSWTLETNDVWHILTQQKGNIYTFYPTGKLKRVEDKWGVGLQFKYDDNEMLLSVTHDNERSLIFNNIWHEPLEAWRVDSIVAPSGIELEFLYAESGQFTQVVERVDSFEYVSTYTYDEKGNLTNKVNGVGQTFTYTYQPDDGRLMQSDIDGYFDIGVNYNDSNTTTFTNFVRGMNMFTRKQSVGDSRFSYGPGLTIQDAQECGTEYKVKKSTTEEDTDGLLSQQQVARVGEANSNNNYGDSESHIVEDSTRYFDSATKVEILEVRHFDEYSNITNIAFAYDSEELVDQLSYEFIPDTSLPSALMEPDGSRTENVYTNDQLKIFKEYISSNQSYNTHFAYRSDGLVSSITNQNEHITRYHYTNAGDLRFTQAAVGGWVEYFYDDNGFVTGRVTRTEQGVPTGRTYQYKNDAHGRLLKTTYPDQLTSERSYNALGLLTYNRDRAGRETVFEYAPRGNLTSTTKYLYQGNSNLPVRVSYDLDERVNTLQITEPRGRYVESYQIDLQDRITCITNIEHQVMDISYTIGTYVDQVARFDGSTVANSYTASGAIKKETYTTPQGTFEVESTYWPDGQFKNITEGDHAVTYKYDLANRLTNIQSRVGTDTSTATYQYDPAGNITNRLIVFDTHQLESSMDYDEAERLTRAGDDHYTFHPENGQLGGCSNQLFGITAAYEYDVLDRLTNITYFAADGSLIHSLDYQRNAVGMVTEKRETSLDYTRTIRYGYDSLDRLISETGSAGTSIYQYDLAGNRTGLFENGILRQYQLGIGNRLDTVSDISTNLLYITGASDEMIGTDHRWGELYASNLTARTAATPLVNGYTLTALLPALGGNSNSVEVAVRDTAGNTTYATKAHWVEHAPDISVPLKSYAYDAAGNLTQRGDESLGWDYKYRLTSHTNGASVVQYGYDSLDRLVSRHTDSGSERYIYDGLEQVADLDENGNILRSYTYAVGIDAPQTLTVYGAATNHYFYLRDHLNSVIALVDQSGTIAESYRYDAFGNTTVFDADGNELAASALGNRFTFHGRYLDWQTGLQNFRARWYDAQTGRWLSKDPIRVAGGLNQYTAFSNNPVNFVDPTGLYTNMFQFEPTDNTTNIVIHDLGINVTTNPIIIVIGELPYSTDEMLLNMVDMIPGVGVGAAALNELKDILKAANNAKEAKELYEKWKKKHNVKKDKPGNKDDANDSDDDDSNCP